MPNTNELFNKYSKWYVAHADTPLMNFDDFTQAIAEIISLPVEPPVILPEPNQQVFTIEEVEKILAEYKNNCLDNFYNYQVFKDFDGQIQELMLDVVATAPEPQIVKTK